MTRSICLAFTALQTSAVIATAQAPTRTTIDTPSDAVILARVDRLPNARAHALIVRRPQHPMHLILVGPSVTPVDLAAAMAGLLRARRLDRDEIRTEQRAMITDTERRRARPATHALAAATRDLALLQRARPVNVPGFKVLGATTIDGRLNLLRK